MVLKMMIVGQHQVVEALVKMMTGAKVRDVVEASVTMSV